MNIVRFRRSVVTFLGCLVIGACGGGGGGGSDGGEPASYSIGGAVSGLGSGASVVLQNNGGDSLTVSASGGFTFPTKLADGSTYSVAVTSQSAGYTCTITNGSGTVAAANVGNVAVSCAGAAPDPNGESVLSPTHKPTLVGVVIDSPVGNLNYSSATQTGATDANGFFSYQQGDLITFKIGDISLPTVVGKPVVTVFDIANNAVYPNRLTNIARFLQSLDSDGDVTNGIGISAVAHAVGAGATLDFGEDTTQFATDANPIIAAVNAGGGTTNTQLIDATTAVNQATSIFTTLPRTSPIAGNWSSGSGATLQVLLLLDDGLYYVLDGNCGGVPSYEFGQYSYESSSGQLTLMTQDDHDGPSCGLNSGTYSLGAAANGFTLSGKSWQYIVPAAGELTGVYGDGDFTVPGVGAEIHVFLQSGEYIELTDCSTVSADIPGIEAGTYTWNQSSKAFAITSHLNSSGDSCGSHTSKLIAPLSASVSTGEMELQVADSTSNEYDFGAIGPSFVGNNLLGGWGVGDSAIGGIMVFTADGKVIISYDCSGIAGPHSSREIGTFAWNASDGSASVNISQDGNGACGFNTLAPSITQLQVHGNMLDIVTSSQDAGTISVQRYPTDGGLVGEWGRAASVGVAAMTIAIYRDASDQWFLSSLSSDCSIGSNDEGVTFDFDANTSTLSNVIFDSSTPDVSGCGLPAAFGGTISLQGGALTIPGLGQFTRVQ